MIERKELLALAFYDSWSSKHFSGSDAGMRYRIERIKNEPSEDGSINPDLPEKLLRATAWPEPFSYEMTPDEQKVTFEAEFSEEGMEEVVRWLNSRPTE